MRLVSPDLSLQPMKQLHMSPDSPFQPQKSHVQHAAAIVDQAYVEKAMYGKSLNIVLPVSKLLFKLINAQPCETLEAAPTQNPRRDRGLS
ncbi:hypothetical protein ACFX2I_023900 [Malus domestica]